MMQTFESHPSGRDEQSRRPIIDMHVHAYSEDPRFGNQFTNPLTGQELQAAEDPTAHNEETFAVFEHHNIVKAFVSGHYEATLRWKEQHPERVIVGYAVDDPAEVDLDFLRHKHRSGQLEVLGEIVAQYSGIAPTDPSLEPLFALAEELDIPVAYHMHPGPPAAPYSGFPKMRVGLGNPLLLEEVLVRHPALRMLVMHAGWPMLDEMIGLLYAHPQVYVDVGAISWSLQRAEFHHYLRRLVECGFEGRIMFGSDQMVWPQLIAEAITAVECADFLTPQQKHDIFFRNAVRFLRLEDLDNLNQPP